jgi:hypothetical protein
MNDELYDTDKLTDDRQREIERERREKALNKHQVPTTRRTARTDGQAECLSTSMTGAGCKAPPSTKGIRTMTPFIRYIGRTLLWLSLLTHLALTSAPTPAAAFPPGPYRPARAAQDTTEPPTPVAPAAQETFQLFLPLIRGGAVPISASRPTR